MTELTKDVASTSVLVSTPLPPAASSAFKARERIRTAVGGRLSPEVLDTLLLLTTELVSNAAACADTPLHLRVLHPAEGTVQVEIADTNPTLPEPQNRGLEADRGRGLQLVDALADAWGAAPTPRGKVMWFVLRA